MFQTSPSALCLVTILVYQLSHVVYAHGLHTLLLRYLRSRIPFGICLPIPLQRRLGYPNPPRSSTSYPHRGSHDPFQRLSQATSVVDITLRALMCIRATASTEEGGLFEDDLHDTEIVLGLTNCLRETGYALEDAQRARLLSGINQVWRRPPTTPAITIRSPSLQTRALLTTNRPAATVQRGEPQPRHTCGNRGQGRRTPAVPGVSGVVPQITESLLRHGRDVHSCQFSATSHAPK